MIRGQAGEMRMSRTKTTPIGAPRTMRMQDVRSLTSLPAGRVVPIAAFPLLREDALRRGQVRLSFEMMETVEVLMNAVGVYVNVHFVSNLALDRFDGMDALNRSYMGKAVEGLPVVPFIEKQAAGDFATLPFYKYLGVHADDTDQINTAYLEAYNQIWNFRARNRSQDLTQRQRLDTSLAPAFWQHQHFRHIVPSFDQAVIDGEVPLNIVSARIPVTGIGKDNLAFVGGPRASRESTGQTVNYGAYTEIDSAGANTRFLVEEGNPAVNGGVAGFPAIFAELQQNGVTVSLSNIELARKTQAFARLKEQYQGINEDYIVDLLMSGIAVPEQALQQPILLAQNQTIFGMSKRYATDSGALTDSVVNGATFLDVAFRVPQMNTGGIVMVTAEVLPEQLFERQRDPYLHAQTVEDFPDYLRDTLDPEKVELVTNGAVDAAHSVPAGTFGYGPLNARWIIQQPRLGGRFYRKDPSDGSNDEDRQRVWAVETIDPQLSADFYIATNIHTKPFVVQNQDPFECVARGMVAIDGLTVFGGALIESTGSYDEVMAKAPMDRIEQPQVVAEAPEQQPSKPLPKPAPKPAPLPASGK